MHELEMTVFGPGVGECIILHLGGGDWIVVDSCLTPGSDVPVALTYLNRIGVDHGCIRCILATHWHDDHIRGLARLVAECPHATFCMASALAGEQFYNLVLEVREANKFVKQTSTAHEFSDILDILENRGGGIRSPNYVHDGFRMFRGGHTGGVEVWALSPSSASITNALKDLADKLLTGTRMFKRFSPNDLSVAVLVAAGPYSLLLGADLENTGDSAFGWKAVLSSTLCPQLRSGTFKVAHHGSSNGDHPDIWDLRLQPDPIAVVTPYLKLANPLPTEDDLDRIRGRSRNGYCTSANKSKKPPRRAGADGIIRGMTKSRRSVSEKEGFVRLRVDLSSPSSVPRVELFGAAFQLSRSF